MVSTESEEMLYALLGILNSKVISLYARENRFILFEGRKTPQIRVTALKSLPIPDPDSTGADSTTWNNLADTSKERQMIGNQSVEIRKAFNKEWKGKGLNLHPLRFHLLEPLSHLGKLQYTETNKWPEATTGSSLEISFEEETIAFNILKDNSSTTVMNIRRTHTDLDNYIYWALDEAVRRENYFKGANSKAWRERIHHIMVPVAVTDADIKADEPYFDIMKSISEKMELPDPLEMKIKTINLEEEIEFHVSQLYGLDDDEIKLVKEYWKICNWKI